MSRDFPGPSSPGNDLTRVPNGPWLPTNPFSMAGWGIRETNVETVCVTNGWRNVTSRCFQLRITTGGLVQLDVLDAGGGGHGCNKSGFTNGAWQHIGFDFNGTQIRTYLNGVAGTPVNCPSFRSASGSAYIGSSRQNSAQDWWDGPICDIAAWSSLLSADEWAAMAKGVSSRMVRPGLLRTWVPIFGPGAGEPDLSGEGFHWTIEGSLAVRNHGPVGCPFPV